MIYLLLETSVISLPCPQIWDYWNNLGWQETRAKNVSFTLHLSKIKCQSLHIRYINNHSGCRKIFINSFRFSVTRNLFKKTWNLWICMYLWPIFQDFIRNKLLHILLCLAFWMKNVTVQNHYYTEYNWPPWLQLKWGLQSVLLFELTYLESAVWKIKD